MLGIIAGMTVIGSKRKRHVHTGVEETGRPLWSSLLIVPAARMERVLQLALIQP